MATWRDSKIDDIGNGRRVPKRLKSSLAAGLEEHEGEGWGEEIEWERKGAE